MNRVEAWPCTHSAKRKTFLETIQSENFTYVKIPIIVGCASLYKKDLNENLKEVQFFLTWKHNHNRVCNASKDSIGKGTQVTFLVIEETSISIW